MRIALSLLVLSLAVASCGGETEPAADPGALEGTPWLLAGGLPGVEIPAETSLSVTFEGGQVSGFSGCNTFQGTYALKGESLSIGPLATTRMACAEPVMQVESAYLEALGSTSAWAVEGGQLVLLGADGELLRYEVASLTGDWQATGYLAGDAFTSLIAGTEITALFMADGTLQGSSGCNEYGSTYTAEGTALELGPISATQRACLEPEGVMEQEQGYLGALQSAVTFRLTGKGLELLDEQGRRVAAYGRG